LHNRLRVLEIDDTLQEDQIKQKRDFDANPHRFAKNLFAPPNDGKPTFGAAEASTFFESTYHDSDRGHKYVMPPELQERRPPAPEFVFDVEVPSFDEMMTQLNRKKNSSTPGRSGLAYLVWKRLPFLQVLLYELFSRAWKECAVPSSWQVALVILLGKTDDTSKPELMRPIALTNCDGKLFFTFLQVRMTAFMIRNKFLDLSVQKAFAPGISGCIEHNQMLWEAFKKAFHNRLAICVSWLDLRNAYGSVRHNLIQFALAYYHFPPLVTNLIFAYYDALVAMVSTSDWSTVLFNYGIGAFQGCTMSTILFNLTFNLMFEWLKSCDVPRFEITDNISLREPHFADDVAFVTRLPSENQQLLNVAFACLQWTKCMNAKPQKCKSLAYAQFKPGGEHRFQPYQDLTYSAFDPELMIAGEMLIFIAETPFKYLGRKFYVSLTEHAQKEETRTKLLKMLHSVEKTALSGRYKLWLYNNAVVCRMSWPLMVYDFPLSFVESLYDMANQFVKRWAGLSLQGPNPTIIYLPKKEKGLGIHHLVHFFQNLGVVREYLLKYSVDPYVVKLAEWRLQRDRDNAQAKWRATIALQTAERGLALDEMSAAGQTTRAGIGFGSHHSGPLPEQGTREHRKAVAGWAKERRVETQTTKLHELTVQSDWRKWTGVMHQDMSWNRILYRMSDEMLKFYLQGTLQVAPTPAYLKRIGIIKGEACCPLCKRRGGALYHILSCCNVALQQGRYTWRHNEVLKLLHHAVGSFIRRMSPEKVRKAPKKKMFVLAGKKPKKLEKPPALLELACDWRIAVDLPGLHGQFPQHISATAKMPDLVVWSDSIRVIILLELTVPSERGVQAAYERKDLRYGKPGGLKEACVGYTVHLLPVEVGTLGFVADSMRFALRKLGVWSKELSTDFSDMALSCSYIIYVSRKQKSWSDWRMFDPTRLKV
jgi:hypothetical protein